MVKGLMAGLLFLTLVAVMTAVYFQKSAEMARKSSITYKQNSEILYSRLKEAYENNVRLDKTKKALEEAAKKDNAVFDWGADISHSPVILQLQTD